ncbi:MAG TPA: UrcA family protein [Rhizomicrobium sp.]|nr:UrcA family protein [Rhizomicrobium sp.]
MRILAAALLAAAAVGAGLVVSSTDASAQTYGYGPPAPYTTVPTDQVIVTAPRYRADHNYLNVPIENVSLSQPVRTDDLDLRTWRGAHELRWRVHVAARQVCEQLIEAYPVGVNGDATCYRDAVAEAMPGVDAAIQTARDYPPGYGGY